MSKITKSSLANALVALTILLPPTISIFFKHNASRKQKAKYEIIFVQPVAVAGNKEPLIRDKNGRFAKYYWLDGKLFVPIGVSEETIKEAELAKQ